MFTEEKFKKYLEMMGIDLACRFCHSKEWYCIAESRRSVNGKDSEDPDQNSILGLVALTANKDGRITDARLGGVGMIYVTCSNCGYATLFSYAFARHRYQELMKNDNVDEK